MAHPPVVQLSGNRVYLNMKMLTCFRSISALVLAAATAVAAYSQDPTPPPAGGQNAPRSQAGGGGYGQRRPGGGGGSGGMMSAGLWGTVTAAGADQYTIKTDAGDVYAVHFSADTRILKMPAFVRREGSQGSGAGQGGAQGGGQGSGGGQGGWQGRGMGGTPPQQLKPTDIKVGDVIQVRGQIDEAAKSVPASAIVQLDPDRVAQMREMNANFGKTWLMGKVTAIDGVKVTLTGTLDSASHSFVADENTTFRQRRDPITLADIQVGDMVRAEGVMKDGVFTATAVNSMGAPPPPSNATMPRVSPPSPQPPPASNPQR
jgi:Domain of unknown function (DUF5666)